MVAKSFVRQNKNIPKTLIIQPKFYRKMVEVLEFGIEKFGIVVAHNFYTDVMNKVMRLPLMPDANPKNRFIESTEKKTYRNILVEKYAVLYSVTAKTIQVITIYHQSMNPLTISNLK